MSCDTRLFVYISALLLLCVLNLADKSNFSEALISGEDNLNNHPHTFNSEEYSVSPPSRRQRREVDSTASNNNASDNAATSGTSVKDSVITLVHLNDSHEQLTG